MESMIISDHILDREAAGVIVCCCCLHWERHSSKWQVNTYMTFVLLICVVILCQNRLLLITRLEGLNFLLNHSLKWLEKWLKVLKTLNLTEIFNIQFRFMFFCFKKTLKFIFLLVCSF